MGDHPATHQNPLPPTNTSPCRVLLGAIRAALVIPYPATTGDENAYLTLRSKRAHLAVQAAETALRPEGGDLGMLTAAKVLTGQLADYPPAGYAHHPMSS
jgi:hypothetical protein